MEGLTNGRIVHYVSETRDNVASIVVYVEDKENGIVTLLSLYDPKHDPRSDVFEINGNCKYSKEPHIGTWHWIPKV